MTLNQIVKEIKIIGINHEQIDYVYFGDVWERLSNGEVVYPALFLTLNSAAFLEKQIQYNFSIYLMDRMLSEETNETDVLSDMTLIGEDVMAQLRNQTQQWLVSNNATITYYTESDPDYLAGIKIDITLTLPSINNRCQVPSTYGI
jgi:hypothetical protein